MRLALPSFNVIVCTLVQTALGFDNVDLGTVVQVPAELDESVKHLRCKFKIGGTQYLRRIYLQIYRK